MKGLEIIGSQSQNPFETVGWLNVDYAHKQTFLNAVRIEPKTLRMRAHRLVVMAGERPIMGLLLKSGIKAELPAGDWEGVPESLANVPGHKDLGEGGLRYSFKGAPLHSSLHIITDGSRTAQDYCTPHTHDSAAEMNVIQGGNLVYDVLEGDHNLSSKGNQMYWFKPGEPHCAIARQGFGLFFVARFPVAGNGQERSNAPEAWPGPGSS